MIGGCGRRVISHGGDRRRSTTTERHYTVGEITVSCCRSDLLVAPPGSGVVVKWIVDTAAFELHLNSIPDLLQETGGEQRMNDNATRSRQEQEERKTDEK